MKCIATGEETNMLSNNLPLSREGREVITNKHKEYNVLLKEKFIEQHDKSKIVSIEQLEKLAPQVSKKFFMRLIDNKTLEGAFKELTEYKKETEEKNEA